MKWITQEIARVAWIRYPRLIGQFSAPHAEFLFIIAFSPTD
jgi:hypothetical protein